MQSNSPLFKLNWLDAWKTVRGGLLTFGGFVLVEGLIALQNGLQTCVNSSVDCQFDLGDMNFFLPTAVTLTGMVLEFIRRWLTNQSK